MTDPSEYDVEPLPRRRGPLYVALGLVLAGGLVAGYAIGCVVIDLNADAPPSYQPGALVTVLSVLGPSVAVVGLVRWLFAITPFPAELTMWHALCSLAFAVGCGLVLATLDLDAKSGYTQAVVIAAVACVLLGGLAEWSTHRRTTRRGRDQELMISGERVVGVVTDPGVTDEDFEDAGTVIGRMTVEFADRDGTTRELHCSVRVPQRARLRVGQRTVVWYDPEHPDDAERMVAAIPHALRWNLELVRPTGPDDVPEEP